MHVTGNGFWGDAFGLGRRTADFAPDTAVYRGIKEATSAANAKGLHWIEGSGSGGLITRGTWGFQTMTHGVRGSSAFGLTGMSEGASSAVTGALRTLAKDGPSDIARIAARLLVVVR